jgi:Tfp pilus assembly ATPase PilU
MLQRDFIMLQIEEFGKVIAQIIGQRNANATRKIPQLVQVVYDSLKIDRNFLLNGEPHDIRQFLDGEDGAGLQRLEIAVKTLLEEAYVDTENAKQIRSKAKELLEYIQARDTTFSLERIQLLQELEELSS